MSAPNAPPPPTPALSAARDAYASQVPGNFSLQQTTSTNVTTTYLGISTATDIDGAQDTSV